LKGTAGGGGGARCEASAGDDPARHVACCGETHQASGRPCREGDALPVGHAPVNGDVKDDALLLLIVPVARAVHDAAGGVLLEARLRVTATFMSLPR